jgi:hypothetical protein
MTLGSDGYPRASVTIYRLVNPRASLALDPLACKPRMPRGIPYVEAHAANLRVDSGSFRIGVAVPHSDPEPMSEITHAIETTATKRLERSRSDRMVLGVSGGCASADRGGNAGDIATTCTVSFHHGDDDAQDDD